MEEGAIESLKRGNILENILVEDFAAEGVCIGRVNEMVVFIKGAIPGDEVTIEILKKKSSYLEAKTLAITKESPDRVKPECSHFGTCGGCKWQNLRYSKQIYYKEKQTLDTLTRIGKIELPETEPILGSKKQFFYRNRLDFSFSNRRWLTRDDMVEVDGKTVYPEGIPMNALGFHIPGKWDKVLDLQKCWLQDDLNNAIRLETKKYAEEHNLSFTDLRKQEGLLRGLILRSTTIGEWMAIVMFREDIPENYALLEHLSLKFPQITALMYVINAKRNEIIYDLDVKVFKGKDHIIEEMEGLKFKIGPKSFYQTNSEQAYELYKVTREFAQIQPHEVVYDLYTGTGTIALFVSRLAKKVVGIEYVEPAVQDAFENARFNKIENVSFFAGDMKDVLNDAFITENGRPDVVITDPPRAGMHADVVETLKRMAPERIVYVSCNPATQARDLQLLDDMYKVERMRPVDMFPHTHHVENVVLLCRRTEVNT